MSATDHKAEATSLLINVQSAHSHDVRAQWLAEAQVHATLALVEQQRIANRIALIRRTVPA